MQLNLSIQRNNPNLMLQAEKHIWRRRKDRKVLYSICHDSLTSLLSTDEFLDYAVELDHPLKFLGFSVKLMCCCDGLVCLWFHNRKRQFFCLWNPTTREYKILPKSKIYQVCMVTLGYDYKSNTYKVLASSGSLFEVYSLGLKSWKSIENVPYEVYACNRPSGVLVNGNLHWLATKKGYSDVLVSLDISNEIFIEIEPPKETYGLFYNLGTLEGCLCLLLFDDDDDHLNIWVMQNYVVQESWTKRFIVKHKQIVDDGNLRFMIWPFESGEVLIGSVTIGTAGLVVYDPDYESVKEPNISSLFSHQQELYFESLVSLESRTYVGEKNKMKNKKKPKLQRSPAVLFTEQVPN
ncbi:F-box protein CPR1-like [Papaver somniferum]|uniref:F-box protein CPR1-like n=1 Tax=Papaver somniferum TaxID=3469 RepID=UPI000E70035D|nr:F-box protein CPR1-like [Papaver somniferum]